MDKNFIVGSKAFFEGMEGFHSIDTDILVLVDKPQGFEHYSQRSICGRNVYEWARKPKKDFIAYAKRAVASGLEYGKFIVPEFAEELGLTIADLIGLYNIFSKKIDAKYDYQRVITDAYIANKGFVLSDAQRAEAYESYKAAREKENNAEDEVIS